jgi:hypothetical protein
MYAFYFFLLSILELIINIFLN